MLLSMEKCPCLYKYSLQVSWTLCSQLWRNEKMHKALPLLLQLLRNKWKSVKEPTQCAGLWEESECWGINVAKTQQGFHCIIWEDADFVCLFILMGLKTIFFLFLQGGKLPLMTFSWRMYKSLAIECCSLLPSRKALLGKLILGFFSTSDCYKTHNTLYLSA